MYNSPKMITKIGSPCRDTFKVFHKWSTRSSHPRRVFSNQQYNSSNPFRSRDGVLKIYGYPLPWWLLGVHGAGGLALGAYYISSYDFEEISRKAATSAWGDQVQLEALLELAEWQDYEMVIRAPLTPALIHSGLLKGISAGIRSSNPNVCVTAWTLASSVTATSNSAAKLLSSDKETHPLPYEKTNNEKSNGLWELIVADLFDKTSQPFLRDNKDQSTKQDDDVVSQPKKVPNLRDLFASPFSQYGSSSVVEDEGMPNDDVEVNDNMNRQELDLSTLGMLQTLANLTEPKYRRLGLKGAFAEDENGAILGVGHSVASEAGCKVEDPRLVFAIIELLTMLHVAYSGEAERGGNSANLVPSHLVNSHLSKAQGEEDDAIDLNALNHLLVDEMVDEMMFVLVEILHNLVATDRSGTICQMLSAKKPVALLNILARTYDVNTLQLSTAPLHAVLAAIDRQAQATTDGHPKPDVKSEHLEEGSAGALMDQLWGPLFPSNTNNIVTKEQKLEIQENRDYAEKIMDLTPPISYVEKTLNYKACNLLDVTFNSMMIAAVYAPIRRWLMWRINGENKLVEQLRAMSGVSSAGHSLRSVLMRSSIRNAAGAVVLSSTFGYFGLIEQTFRRQGTVQDLDRAPTYHFWRESGKLAMELGILGIVLNFAPYCVLPTVFSALL